MKNTVVQRQGNEVKMDGGGKISRYHIIYLKKVPICDSNPDNQHPSDKVETEKQPKDGDRGSQVEDCVDAIGTLKLKKMEKMW